MLILPRNHFSDEFKQDAMWLVESGIPQKQVCADLGVSTSALQAWGEAQLAAHSLPTSGGDPEATRANAQTLKRIRELDEN